MSDDLARPGTGELLRHPDFVEREVRVVGRRWSPRAHQLRLFLARSRVPFRWYDPESDSASRRLLSGLQPVATDAPVVLLPDGAVLIDPEIEQLAQRLGLPTEPSSVVYDLIIVGGGSAGLSAAIHAGSEGLHTIVVEQEVPGGQATYSAMIENYPGFPHALDGSELARRTVDQAERFGVEIVVTQRATRLRVDAEQRGVTLDDGTEITARSVVLAIGVSFRWLDSPGCLSLVGAGIYYGAATVEAASCRNQDVHVLGGGNSAGQAALFLARYARKVNILTTDDALDRSMSKYLIDRIEQTPNIEVHPHTTVVDAGGSGHAEWLLARDTKTGEERRIPTTALFVFIGAQPRSEWLEGVIDRDEQGFLWTGADYACEMPESWPLSRQPFPLETRVPGVFAAGDVRKGSIKRLTAAAGEGAMAVHYVHQYLSPSNGATGGQEPDAPNVGVVAQGAAAASPGGAAPD